VYHCRTCTDTFDENIDYKPHLVFTDMKPAQSVTLRCDFGSEV